MDKQLDYMELVDKAETQMLQLSDTVAQLRGVVDRLIEENNKLRMSNNDLKRLLFTVQEKERAQEAKKVSDAHPHSDDTTKVPASGRDSLMGFYNEGIHVCHEFFGSRRLPHEQCLFCQEVLRRLEA